MTTKGDASMMDERRDNIRKPCFFVEVDYSVGHKIFTDTIKNISAGGVFIETKQPFDIGTDLKMLFSDYSNINLIQIEGDVVRKTSNGVGVKFDMERNIQQTDLVDYISKV